MLKLGTWNVRTMTPGLSEYLQEVCDAHKAAVINNELCRLWMDIVTLQETRLSSPGMLREKDHTFYWQEKSSNEWRKHRVGFAIKTSLLDSIIPPADGTERILKLQLQTSARPVSLISAYARTMTSSSEAKDRFYDELSAVMSDVPPQEPRSFSVISTPEFVPSCLGDNGIGKINENGQHLLKLCCHNLCITNTYIGSTGTNLTERS